MRDVFSVGASATGHGNRSFHAMHRTALRARRWGLAAVLVALLSAPGVLAIDASPFPVELQQPDGTKITLQIRGTAMNHWFEDSNGFTVVRNGGAYEYAVLDLNGKLQPTGLMAGRDNPAAWGLPPGMVPAAAASGGYGCALPMPGGGDDPQGAYGGGGGPSGTPASGTVKNLVVLCMFSDHTPGVHGRNQADYDVLFNAVGGDPTLAPTGSVKDVFTENSYGTMTLASTVVAWVTLPQNEAYYGNGQNGIGSTYPNNAQGMVRDALDLVDSLVDFGQFDQDNDGYIDAISIVHSGYGAETGGGGGNWIWSHKWSLWALPGGNWTSSDPNGVAVNVKVYDYHTEPALWGTSGTLISRIGVAAHETGHFFGLPDLYDTNGGSRGIGSWGMMANSWGFDGTQQYPPHFSAWSKIQLGWVTPTVISAAATYTVPRVQTTATIFKITNGYPSGEYLLIENRQAYGFDALIAQGGLAIWHIDENKATNRDQGYPGQSGWPGNNNHYKVALLQADGQYHLEKNGASMDAGDVYHAGGVTALHASTTPNTDAYQGGSIIVTNNAISNVSASSNSMTFDYTNASSAAVMISPANGSTFSSSSVTFNWTAGTGVTQYWLEVGTVASPTAYFSASTGTTQSQAVSTLPTDGSAVQARLWSLIGSTWSFNTYNYIAHTVASAGATMTSPADGSTFTSSSVTFNWSAGTGVNEYWLEVGTPASPAAYYSASTATSQSQVVSGLPSDGSAVRARLWSRIGSTWSYNTYNYTAYTGASSGATMISPADGSTFSSSSVTFNWSAGSGVSEYWLEVGTPASPGAYYSASTGTSQSQAVSGLPTDGSAIRARLWSLIGSTWSYNTYNYTAQTASDPHAVMTSPADGSTFGSSSVTFNWTAGTGVIEYWLEVGTAASPTAYFSGSTGTTQSQAVTTLPTNGSAVQVRLWSLIGGSWGFNTYNYTASGP
ncbi:MAG: M6 family metalloprotease domain-containing protein [Planctomycetes bacterium]|nr:M6 family metalloprotease domain-containing protein [Planctomycetota bacterium]